MAGVIKLNPEFMKPVGEVREEAHTYIIPGWIYKALLRNSLNNIDIVDYSKFRPYLSLTDLAEWFHLNNSLKIDDVPLADMLFSTSFKNLTPAAMTELTQSVLPLSGTDEIADTVQSRLETIPGSFEDSATSYKLITLDKNLYIVLHEGFLAHMRNLDFKAKFIIDCLKEYYKFNKISVVSTFAIFKIYLKLCKASERTSA